MGTKFCQHWDPNFGKTDFQTLELVNVKLNLLRKSYSGVNFALRTRPPLFLHDQVPCVKVKDFPSPAPLVFTPSTVPELYPYNSKSFLLSTT